MTWSENWKAIGCGLLIASICCGHANAMDIRGDERLGNHPSQEGKIDHQLWKGDVIVDGRVDEWDESTFRFDPGTEMWYSWAHDDMYLYVAAKKSVFPDKIFNSDGGFKVYISPKPIPSSGANDAGARALTYPVSGERGKPTRFDYIEIVNIPGIDSSRIPLYNPYGIQASCTFVEEGSEDLGVLNGFFNLGTCYFEMAIPLSLLGTGHAVRELSLYILLPGNHLDAPPTPTDFVGWGMGSGDVRITTPQGGTQTLSGKAREYFRAHMTDGSHWGEWRSTYRLAVERVSDEGEE